MTAEPAAVTNASPLVFLGKLGELELLPEPVATTPSVLDEIRAGDPRNHPEVELVDRVVEQGRIREIDPMGDALGGEVANLHKGEASVLTLAMEQDIENVIVDDKVAIRTAKTLGLDPTSTPFLLLNAARSGTLTVPEFHRRLDRLLEHGYHPSPRLYRRLREAADS